MKKLALLLTNLCPPMTLGGCLSKVASFEVISDYHLPAPIFTGTRWHQTTDAKTLKSALESLVKSFTKLREKKRKTCIKTTKFHTKQQKKQRK